MKKRLRFCKRLAVLCAFFVLFMAPGMGWGQITEGFESGLPTSYSATLSSVTLQSGSWQVANVIAGTTGVNSGLKSAQIKSATGAQMITPTIDGGVSEISFYITASTTSGAYQVNVSTDNGVNWVAAPGSPFTIGTTKTLKTISINSATVNKVQFYRTGATIYIDDVSISSFGSSLTPTITVNSSILSDFTYVEGSGPSAEQTFTVSGSDLTADISIAAPTNYEISKTSGTGYTTPLTFTPAQAATPQTVYVRLKAGLSAGDYNSEVITASSTGATSKTVTCSGTVTAPASPEPSSHATNFTAGVTAPTYSAVDVIWTDATGGTVPDGYVVKASDVSYAAIAAPVDGVPETAGALVKVVDAGVEEAGFTGLDENTTYYFKIWPFTNSGAAIDYKTDGSVPQDEATTTYGLPGAPTATAASDVSTGSFTANWNTLPAATSYRLDVYTIETGINAADLFISEYVEGSSNNKYIEIYNGTGNTVDLSIYSIKKQTNGVGEFAGELSLIGTLANGEVYVVANSLSNATILAQADQTTGGAPLDFNGNDAVALYKSGIQIDVVGVVNQTSDWGKDVTLVRKNTVTSPDVNYSISDWDSYSVDTFTYLGSHTMAGGNSQAYVSGYENLNVGNVGSYTVTGLNPGTAYYYVVRAVNDAGTSANSSEISATTTLPAYVLVGAHDNASNYSSWVNTSDEGCGFGAWSLYKENNAGFFLGDPSAAGITMTNPSFGLYANTTGTDFANADRAFVAPLAIGSTLSFDWGVNWDAGGAGNKGINLYTGGIGGAHVININMGGNATITINGNTMFSNYGTTAMTINFAYVSAGQLRVYGTGRDGSETYDQTIAVAGAPDAIRFYASGLQTGDVRQPYFNNLKIITDIGGIPAVSSVTVKGCVTLEDDLEVEDLTIESGNTLHISGLSDLTVNGVLTNNAGTGGLLLQSDGAATGSLIHHTANVPATVQLYLTGAAEAWHLLSSPVENQAVSGDFTPSGTYGDGTGYDLYAWDEPTETWLNQKTGSNNITSFVPAKGYLAAYQSVGLTKSFTGTLNEGIYLPAVSASGTGNYKRANLLGNPYPSSIDWKSVTGLDKSALEGFENGGVSFYVWNEAASNYGVYNDASAGDAGTNGTSRYIAPMQGFFVIAAQAGEFGMDNDARAHNAQAWLKSGSENEFRLTVTAPSNAGSDEVLLDFGHAGVQGGAEKWYSMAATAPALYVPSAEKDYSIRFLSSVSDYPAIPLAFKAGLNGEYTLSAGFHPAAYSSVMLTDHLTGKVHDLKANPVYAFTAATGDDPGRFLLSFGSLGIEGPQAEDQIQIYACAGTLYLNTTSLAPAMVKVYNLTGQLVMEAQTAGHALTALPAQGLSQGIYVVNVVAGDRVMSRKVAIRP